jgi:hypothetical protein
VHPHFDGSVAHQTAQAAYPLSVDLREGAPDPLATGNGTCQQLAKYINAVGPEAGEIVLKFHTALFEVSARTPSML